MPGQDAKIERSNAMLQKIKWKPSVRVMAFCGWFLAAIFFSMWLVDRSNIAEYKKLLEGWKVIAADWKKVAQDANGALLVARADGDPKKVLLPKGALLESSDGGKTFRVNEIGK